MGEMTTTDMDKGRGRKRNVLCFGDFPSCSFVHSTFPPPFIHSLTEFFSHQTPPTHDPISSFSKSLSPDVRGTGTHGQAWAGDMRLVSLPPL